MARVPHSGTASLRFNSTGDLADGSCKIGLAIETGPAGGKVLVRLLCPGSDAGTYSRSGTININADTTVIININLNLHWFSSTNENSSKSYNFTPNHAWNTDIHQSRITTVASTIRRIATMQLTTVLLAAFTGMAAAQYNATTTAGYCPSQSQPSGGYTYGSNNPWPYASATAPSNSTGANATSSNSPAYYTGAASNLNAQSLGAVVLGGFAVAVAAL